MATPETRLKQIQLYIAKMPSLPTTVTRVLDICNNPESSPNELNRVISLDPVLTGQVLKMINSAYYSLPNRVTSLTRAIIMLGINTVKNLVLATSVMTSFKESRTISGFSIDTYWAHCLSVGVTAKAIAKLINVPAMQLEEFFVAGLLHDLGKLPMMACFGEQYRAAVDASIENCRTLCETERAHIGFDHCQVGLMIGAKWKLNETMCHAIVNHQKPFSNSKEPDRLLSCISLANQIAHKLDISEAGDAFSDELMIHELSEYIGLNVDARAELKTLIVNEIEKAKIFLEQGNRE